MRLADYEITVAIGGEAIHLRPTLRAAFRLERRYEGFEAIVKAIMDGNFTVIADVIRECSDRFTTAAAVLSAIGAQPLAKVIADLTAPVLAHVASLMGIDSDASEQPASGKRITFLEYHTRLFQIATGHLGWPPDAAWNATPAEIIEASKGRNRFITDLLAAIFGSNSESAETQPASSDDALDREGLEAVRSGLI